MHSWTKSDSKSKTILIIGCFDTKGEDFAYLYSCLQTMGVRLLSMNTGTMGTTVRFPVDIEADEVVKEGGSTLEELRRFSDRGKAIEEMGNGAARIVARLVGQGAIDGAIGMGGGGGTYIALTAMQAMPIGMPKLCLSTVAAKDLSRQVGTRDIVLMPSIVDVAGINKISRLLIRRAAGAITGMVSVGEPAEPDAIGTIAVSMFGNTTACVDHCTSLLRERGYDVLAFHAVGTGGRTMESLIREGFIDGVLDITTTELADHLCDGICSAGPERLTAASDMGVPQVVVPGCLDMVNYGHPDTVPERFRSRQFYNWAPDVTLMRTNEEENRILGNAMAEKLNASTGRVKVLLPLKGISKVSSRGGPFYAPEIDRVLFETLKDKAGERCEVVEIAANINDPVFAEKAVVVLLDMMRVNS